MLIQNTYDTYNQGDLTRGFKMEIWHIWALVGFIFLLIEMMTPTSFFLTLAGSSFFAGIASYVYPESTGIQVGAFVIFLPIFYFAIKPFMDKKDKEPQETGLDAKYLGQSAIVSKTIGKKGTNGVGEIKIYGEVWQAKSCDGSEIEPDTMVKIVRNESLIMSVERC